MTTIVQADQLVTSLPEMKAYFVQSAAKYHDSAFASVFASELSDAEAAVDEMAAKVPSRQISSMLEVQNSDCNTYRLTDLITRNADG